MAFTPSENNIVEEQNVGADQIAPFEGEHLDANGWLLCGNSNGPQEDGTWYVSSGMPNAELLRNMCTAQVDEYCK
jgi:hypothetical protein